MPSEPVILAFDTSAAHCAAAVVSSGQVLAAVSERRERGQAERLFPLLEDVLHQVGLTWGDLTRIGVGIGPGNFTGIRISVSAARGLALSLGVPAIGVNSFDAVDAVATGHHVPFVPAPRGQGYLRDRARGDIRLAGEAELSDIQRDAGLVAPDPDTIAIGIASVTAARAPGAPPAPLYVRPADAAPSRDVPPVILNDA